ACRHRRTTHGSPHETRGRSHRQGPARARSAVASHQGGRLGLRVRSAPPPRKLAEGGVGPETRQVCENLKAVLEAAGSSLAKVVKVTIYMVDLNELMEMNGVVSGYFPAAPA